MGTYNLPRNVKGEGRILFIFTRKSLMYTAGFAIVGLILLLIFRLMNLMKVGVVILLVFILLGFVIGTIKVPNMSGVKWAKVNAGENLDDVIIRAIKFKAKKNKIYIYKGKTQMTSNISLLTTALVVIAGVMVTLLVVLAVVYLKMKLKEKEKEEGLEKKTNTQTAQKDESKMKQYTVNSVFDFMEFEKIEDNMIVQKKRKKIYYGGRVPRNKL